MNPLEHDVTQREPWAPPKAQDLGTAAEARNQAISTLDGRGLGHRQS